MKRIIQIFIVICTFASLLSAQNGIIIGTVTNSSNTPLYGANVIINNTLLGTATDETGKFLFENLDPQIYSLKISMIGYESFTLENIEVTNSPIELSIKLKETTYKSDQVVVTAGKYAQSISDLPVSASIISAETISKKNFKTFDKALRYVPGVTMTLDQVSIRGSSGYSRGAGTRVLVAFDGIPMYTGDSGEIIWEIIPSHEIERVEIIKGSASSLYGSSAIGGVINIIPKAITSNPVTFIKTYYGVYDEPSFSEWDWTDNIQQFNGISVSHSQRFGKLGLSASLYRFEDFGYRQNDYDRRLGGYLKLSYDISSKAKVNIWGTGYDRAKETFNFWKDITRTLSPPDGDLGDSQPSNRQIFGATYENVLTDNFQLTIKPSFYRTHWQDETESNNKSDALLFRNEFQTTYQTDTSSILVSGFETQYSSVESNIFGNNNAYSIGVFSQFEYNFNSQIILNAGIRYDYSKLKNLTSESSFSPKLGLNYKIDQSFIIRASVGTGFRAPTLAEAFTSTVASGVSVKPNPKIKSERSLSFEVGISQSINRNLNVDAAIFHNEYYDLIEPRIDPTDSKVVFDNVTRARIQGFEISARLDLLPQFITLNLGYNYLWARDIEENTALRYRHRHTGTASLDINYGIVNLGTDFRYASRAEQIDFELVDFGLVPNGDQRVDIKVLDVRAGLNLFIYNIPGRVFLNANNLLNYNYVEMIGNAGPIRNYSISFEFLF
jgi:outer membrane receptor for ferrienterochelin and colicins